MFSELLPSPVLQGILAGFLPVRIWGGQVPPGASVLSAAHAGPVTRGHIAHSLTLTAEPWAVSELSRLWAVWFFMLMAVILHFVLR